MNKLTDIQEIYEQTSQECLQKIQKASSFRTVNIISVMKWGNEQTDRQTINMKLFEVLYKNPRNVSRKFEKKIAHLELDIIISVRKRGNEQTDRHTRNPKLFRTSAKTSQEYLPKI